MNLIIPQYYSLLNKVLGISGLILLGNIDLSANMSLSVNDSQMTNISKSTLVLSKALSNNSLASNYSGNIKEGIRVYFESDSTRIKAEFYPWLHQYAKTLQSELAETMIEISGHTDNIGSDEYNKDLSQRRAQAVKNILLSKYKISANRLIVKGYGENQPLDVNENREGRAINRRVELKIVPK